MKMSVSTIALGCLLAAQQGLAEKIELGNETWAFEYE